MILRYSASLLFGFLLINQASVFAQPVYKWTDESGKVRYSDSPPPNDAAVSTVDIAPGPTEAQKQQAESLMKQQSESADNYKAKRDAEKAAADEAKKQQPRVDSTSKQEEEKEDDGSRNARRCQRGDIGWPCTPPITNPIYPPKPGLPGNKPPGHKPPGQKPIKPLPKPLPAKTTIGY